MVPSVLGRPLYERAYVGAWLLLVAPLLLGVESAVGVVSIVGSFPFVTFTIDQAAVNFEVYYYAAAELLAGGDVYEVSPPDWGDHYQYLYPPVTLFVFLPFLLVGPTVGYWAFLLLNGLAAVLLTALIVRYVESLGRPLGWVDVLLIGLHVAVGTHLVANYVFGNVNLFLAVGVAAGIYLLETGPNEASAGRAGALRESLAGVALAAVALFKVFPAILGLYLLRIRSWWGVTGAVATGVGGIAFAEVAFAVGQRWGWQAGDRAFGFGITERWIEQAVLPRSSTELFVGGFAPDDRYFVTFQRPLSHVLWGVWEGAPSWLLLASSFVVGLAVAGAFLVRADTRIDRLAGAFAVTAVAVLVMPSLRFYVALLYLPLIALAYVLERHPVQPLVVAGAAVMAYTDRPGDVLEALAVLPEPAQAALRPILATTSLQLLGILLVLLALALLQWRYDDRDPATTVLPAAACERRPLGPPLWQWVAERGGWRRDGAVDSGTDDSAADGTDG